MPIIAAGIAAGGSLIGGLAGARSERKSANKQNAQNEAQRAAAFKYLQGVGSRDALFAGLEESALKAGHKKQLAGFSGAKKAMDLGGIAARQTVKGREKQGLADVEQSAVSRGLMGTSTGAQAYTGLQDRTTAQLASIDQQLAQALAGLGMEEANVQGEQGRELAGLAGRNRQFQQELGYEMASLAPRMTRDQTVGLRESLWGTQAGTGSMRQSDMLAALLGSA